MLLHALCHVVIDAEYVADRARAQRFGRAGLVRVYDITQLAELCHRSRIPYTTPEDGRHLVFIQHLRRFRECRKRVWRSARRAADIWDIQRQGKTFGIDVLGERRRSRFDKLAFKRCIAHVYGFLYGGIFNRDIRDRIKFHIDGAFIDILRGDGRFEILRAQDNGLADLDRFALAVDEIAGIVAIDQRREDEVLLQPFKASAGDFFDVDKVIRHNSNHPFC